MPSAAARPGVTWTTRCGADLSIAGFPKTALKTGDAGCGVQYFSQQGGARLAATAGFNFPERLPLPERLVEVQQRMEAGNEGAAAIFRTIGVCFGYTLAWFREFYEFRNLLVMGRVTTGRGGEILLAAARDVLTAEVPEYAGIRLATPDETNKRHGQAIAAASLPRWKV